MRRSIWAVTALVATGFAVSGCGSFTVAPSYVSQDLVDPQLGQGRRIRIVVLDERPRKGNVGVTADIYEQEILLDRPAEEIVAEAFRQALTESNWAVDDAATLTCQVKLFELQIIWAAEFGSSYHAKVAMNVAYLYKGESVGIGRFSHKYSRKKNLSDDIEAVGEDCLSIALSTAVEKAVSDRELITKLVR